MDPQGARTLKYVERVWQILQSGQWPPSTAPGELFELKWKLEIAGKFDGEMRLIDAAGQDMRLLFGDDEIQSIESLPSHLRPLAEYCRGADIFLFLVNLKDFIGHDDPNRRIVNEAFLKSALDYSSAGGHPRRICLVLTQADQYLQSAKKCGGWENLIAQVIPYAFNAHIREKSVSVFPVAAVGETTVAVEKGQKPRRIPKRGFKSEGLSELIIWLTAQIEDTKKEFDKEAETSIVLAQQQAALQVVTSQPSPAKGDFWKEFHAEIRKFVAGKDSLVSLFIAVLLGGGCFLGSALFGKPTRPVATFVKQESRDVPAVFFDDGVVAFGIIRNDGATGKVRVWAKVTENGKEVETQNREFYLKSGESTNYYFSLNKIYSVSSKHEVVAWADIPE